MKELKSQRRLSPHRQELSAISIKQLWVFEVAVVLWLTLSGGVAVAVQPPSFLYLAMSSFFGLRSGVYLLVSRSAYGCYKLACQCVPDRICLDFVD